MINKIHNENCLLTMARMPDDFIDLTVTSPPYDNLRTYDGSLDWGEHIWKPVIQDLFRITKQGGVVVWVVGDATIKGSETGTSFKQALYFKEIGFNLHDTMIWRKTDPPPPYYSLFLCVFKLFSKIGIGKFQIVCNRLTISENSSAKKIARHIFRFMVGFSNFHLIKLRFFLTFTP